MPTDTAVLPVAGHSPDPDPNWARAVLVAAGVGLDRPDHSTDEAHHWVIKESIRTALAVRAPGWSSVRIRDRASVLADFVIAHDRADRAVDRARDSRDTVCGYVLGNPNTGDPPVEFPFVVRDLALAALSRLVDVEAARNAARDADDVAAAVAFADVAVATADDVATLAAAATVLVRK